NGQAPFGADVISRISHGMNGPDAIRELQEAVVTTMNAVLEELYRETGVSPEQTYEAVVVGNVTMLHLLLGVDPSPLSMSPFTPAFMDELAVEGVQLGDGVELQVIGGDVPAEGICGSGLVDAVAQLLLAGLLDHSGRLRTPGDVPNHPLRDRLIEIDGVRAFLLADGVYLTQ